MIIHILNPQLEVVGVIDDFYSLIWAERHCGMDDFELVVPDSYEFSPYLVAGNLLQIQDSNVVMMIQSRRPEFNDTESKVIFTGESLKTLLRRRHLDGPIIADGLAETIMYDLVVEHFVLPANSKRTIALLSETNPPTPSFAPTYFNLFEEKSIFDICVEIGEATGLGFRIDRVGSSGAFVVYQGTNRSFGQNLNPWVIFSPEFDNVLNGAHVLTQKDVVTVVKVTTDDAVLPYVEVWAEGATEPEGLARFETSLNTTINREPEDGVLLDDGEVYSIILTRGRKVIRDKQPKVMLEGAFDIGGNFKYGTDFFLGDLVQVAFKSASSPARVTELVRSYSTDGITTYATMEFINVWN